MVLPELETAGTYENHIDAKGCRQMIRIEHIDVWGFEHAIRGMRNPLNSWDKSDSTYLAPGFAKIGKADRELMRRLYKGGTEHRKFLRQIMVSMDITAPLYWWKEFDTYKVGTVANSCSTMHKIAGKEFDISDFSADQLHPEGVAVLQVVINALNRSRDTYLQTKDKSDWWQMIQLLPASYNQRRTVTMNYENAVTIIRQRAGHKLDEWLEFVSYLTALPHLQEIAE